MIQHHPKIVTGGLVAYYDAGNKKSYSGSGATWIDLTKNKKNTTLYNVPSFSSLNGGYLTFNGSNQYGLIGISNDPTFLFGSSDFSIELWCYVAAFSGSNIQTVINNYGSTTTGWNIQLNCVNTNNVRFSYGDATIILTGNNTISAGQWTHIAITRIGTSTNIWINGKSSTSGTNSTNISSGATLTIAKGSTGATQYFNGNLSLLRIYSNKGLSSSEILQNYNATKGRFGL